MGDAEYVRDECLDNEEMRKIYVSGIPIDVTEEDVKSLFEKVSGGTVTDVAIVKKEGEKRSHFGFATFETSELVDEVLLQRGSLKLNDKELSVNRAVPKNIKTPGAHERTKKLFIANLPKTSTEDELRSFFEARHPKKYGTIEQIQLIKKKGDDGAKLDENKGYGFVMVSSEDMADKMSIQHATFHFGGRKIELKKSVPTNDGGGRGRGRGAKMGMPGRGGYGAQYAGYGGYGGGYDAGFGAGYGYGGYNPGFAGGGYGGGYAAPQGRGRGAARFAPY